MPAAPLEESVFPVPLEGYVMQLRPSELDSVAAGVGVLDAATDGHRSRLAEALRRLAVIDRPPTWELAVRHFGRRKPLAQAAGEIGMDTIRAADLLALFSAALG
jgi:hypothetical protein